MKNITIAKQLLITLTIGMACSAHAQLLGRGGAVGGMVGGAGNFGGMASFDRSAMRPIARPATSAVDADQLRQSRSTTGAAASEASGNSAISVLSNAPAGRQVASDGQATGSGSGSAIGQRTSPPATSAAPATPATPQAKPASSTGTAGARRAVRANGSVSGNADASTT